MLALDDPRWSELQQAYGDASSVPDMLRELTSSTGPTDNYEEEPWFGLWSGLCHQGDVYTASYAAVPHIVQIASEATGPIDFAFFQFPASVEVARSTGHGPEIPEQFADDYHRAIARLAENASRQRDNPWSQTMLLSILAALAAAKGHVDVAEALLNLDENWIAKINNFEFD